MSKVFRIEKNKNYTVMSNYHFRDKNISLKAKGLLSQMLSLPEDWEYSINGLAAINKEIMGTDKKKKPDSNQFNNFQSREYEKHQLNNLVSKHKDDKQYWEYLTKDMRVKADKYDVLERGMGTEQIEHVMMEVEERERGWR